MIGDEINENGLEIQEETCEPVIEEGLIIVPEDNLVSEEEEFIESEDDDLSEGEIQDDIKIENEEVVVADIEDHPESTQTTNSRPRRANAGAGVERIQMDFKGKGYGARREFNLAMNNEEGRGDLNELSHESFMRIACDVLFAQTAKSGGSNKQMSANRGFKMYGEAAVAAIIKEFTQLTNGAAPGKPVVRPVDASTLTSDEKRKAMPAVNLIKEKWNGEIKGRTCADGSGQRKYLRHDESIASPTASLESLFVTFLIDAYERRDVATYDVPGAYLYAKLLPRENNERVLMKLTGKFVDIMCKVNPEHTKNVVMEKGKKVLYLEILRALYGCIESALRWYELYT